MPREKHKTLTEQMYYVLLCLKRECFGLDLMDQIRALTSGRVNIGPGTMYHLLDEFLASGLIRQTKSEGRRKCYLITEKGMEALAAEYQRLCLQITDYQNYPGGEEGK